MDIGIYFREDFISQMYINIHQCLLGDGSFYLVSGINKKNGEFMSNWELVLYYFYISQSLDKTNLSSEKAFLLQTRARASCFKFVVVVPCFVESDQNILPPHLCFSTFANCVLPWSLRETMQRPTGIPIVNARRCFDCSCYDSFTLREYQHHALFVLLCYL